MTDVVIKGLGLDEQDIILSNIFDLMFFGVFPFEMMNFGIKIQRQEAEIVARKVIATAGVAESCNDFHKMILS